MKNFKAEAFSSLDKYKIGLPVMNIKEMYKLAEVFNYLKDNSILIGSRAYGGFTEDSDYDFCMEDKKFNKLLPRIEQLVKVAHLYGTSACDHETLNTNLMRNLGNFKFKLYKARTEEAYSRTEGPILDEVMVNIITYDKEGLEKIKLINEAFDALSCCELYNNVRLFKDARVAVFECFKNIVFNFSPEKHKEDEDEFPF